MIGVVGLAVPLAAAAQTAKPARWDGSRVTPVHHIPLKDEFGETIVPTERNPLPFSARTTCAPCHDYDIVRKGRHFDAGRFSPAGRPGEPWIFVDERTGTQIPISLRPWKKTFRPADLGLSGWDFTLRFGRHFPGGGVAEPAEAEMGPGSRWGVSGTLEVNCLGCHNARPTQNPSEWAKQILRENFRWAATAASGLGEVGGMSSRLAPTWDLFDGPNPDDTEWAVAPSVRYDRTLFDGKHRAFIDIAGQPGDGRCLACHASSPAEAKKFDFEEDVHTAAGLACVACHRHDVSHAMIRGYEGEGKDNPAVLSEEFTCRGCHLGGRSAAGKKVLPGRLGAPFPKHFGLPKVHLDRLSCTACHSGPIPAREPGRVRTSRANRLGIYGIADWVQEMPAVVEPVFMKDTNGKITPHRLFWPAYWGKRDGKEIAPLRPEEVHEAAGDLLYPEKPAVRILTALFYAADLVGVPVLVMDGNSYSVNLDGGLEPAEFPGGKKGDFRWALKVDGEIRPLVPDFDPGDEEAAAEPEIFIQKLLEALRTAEAAPGEPVFVLRGYQYKIV
ncbi:MAG: cytochrome c3 family protein, partial [Candidatus Aminicenantes bacterium]|nr:cytochrome c3 family protein [Candidatus Aminicenantes bacterium]